MFINLHQIIKLLIIEKISQFIEEIFSTVILLHFEASSSLINFLDLLLFSFKSYLSSNHLLVSRYFTTMPAVIDITKRKRNLESLSREILKK